MSERIYRDATVSQLGRENNNVSGRRSALGATRSLHRLNSSTPQLDDSNQQNTTKQYVGGTGHYSEGSRSIYQSFTRSPSAYGQRPPTAPGHRRRAVRHNVGASYVDESLFGPVIDTMSTASWQPKQRPVKPFIFDCTDYKKKSANDNVPSSRPSSARSRPRSARLHHEPSFIDESLFGDQLEVNTWRAPWHKKDHKPKPFVFDATNYREKQQNADNSKSATSADRKRMPPWR